MVARFFRNGPATNLAAAITTAVQTTCTVVSASGFPTQFPYTAIIDPDISTEEVVDVTAAVGNVLTITRGVDSTTAVAHANGAIVYHGVSARDAREANDHVNQTLNVHGRTGSLVDTGSVQTISAQKTFTGGLLTTAGALVDVSTNQTVAGNKTFSGTNIHSGPNTFSGANTFSSTNAFNAGVTFGSTEGHTGAETHSGTAVFSNDVTIDGIILPGAWTAYSPIRKNGTAGATLGSGNGTLVGFTKRLGKLVYFRILYTAGSTGAIGTTTWVFTLPSTMIEGHQSGPALIGNAAGTLFARTWHGLSSGSNEVVVTDEAANRVSSSSPFPWSGGETVALTGVYESA